MQIMNSYGVSEVIGLVTITMIATSSIGVIVFWGIPTMESQKIFVRVESALKQFRNLNKVIQRVSTEGINKSDYVDFVTDAGQVSITHGDRFIIYYPLVNGFRFDLYGLDDSDEKKFNIDITSGWNGGSLQIYYLYTDVSHDNITLSSGVGIKSISSSYDCFKAVKMEIKNANATPVIVGRIWLFDAGSISYDLATSGGIYNIVAENEGVLNIQQGSGYVYQKPSIYNDSYSFVMRMTRLQPVGAVGGSGMSKYEFTIKSNATAVEENKLYIPRFLEIKIYGDEKAVDAWTDYFKSEFGFSGANGDLSFNAFNKNMYLTLVYSLCDVTLG